MQDRADDLTTLLNAAVDGQAQAFNEAIQRVYPELRQIARHRMQRQFNRPLLDGLTRQPTDIVHDAVMKLADQYTAYQNRGHFFAIATKLIIQVITDYQRARLAAKRGGGDRGQNLPEDAVATNSPAIGWQLEVVESLKLLEQEDARAAEAFILRTVLGESTQSIAQMLGVSLATAERDLRYARAFFKSQQLQDSDP